MKKILFTITLSALLLSGGCMTNSVSGTWVGGCETSDGKRGEHISLKLHQHGNKITGTSFDEKGATAKIRGTIKGNSIKLELSDTNFMLRMAGIVQKKNITGIWASDDQTGSWIVRKK